MKKGVAMEKILLFIKEDIVMYKEIHKTVAFLKRHQVNY